MLNSETGCPNWHKVLDSVNEPMAFISREHDLIWANRAMEELSGSSSDLPGPGKCHDSICQRGFPPAGCPHLLALLSGESHQLEIKPARHGRIYLETCHPVKDGAGNVQGSVLTWRDITETRKLERRIRNIHKSLEALIEVADSGMVIVDQNMKVMVANHKLGQLLGLDSSALVWQDPRRIIQERLQVSLEDEAAQEKRLFYQFSYPEEIICDEIEIQEPRPCRLRRYYGPVYDDHGQYLGRIGIFTDISVKTQPENGSIMPGGEPPQVEQRITTMQEELDQVQERLHQIEKMSALGELTMGAAREIVVMLSRISELVQLMLESESVPDRRDDLQRIGNYADRGRSIAGGLLNFAEGQPALPEAIITGDKPARANPVERTGTPLTGFQVLVIDPDEITLSIITRALEQDGHTVTRAANANKAMTLLRSRTFDLIITDPAMPELDGRKLHLYLHDQDPDREHRLIFTGAMTPGGEKLPPSDQADAILLAKPLSINDLRQTINRFISDPGR